MLVFTILARLNLLCPAEAGRYISKGDLSKATFLLIALRPASNGSTILLRLTTFEAFWCRGNFVRGGKVVLVALL